MDTSTLRELFQRYLDGQCAPEEVAHLVRLLREPGASEALQGPLRAVWESEGREEYLVDWDAVHEAVVSHAPGRRLARRRGWWAPTVAASVVAVLGISLTVVHKDRAPHIAARTSAPSVSVSPSKTQTLHLSDGTTVILNVGSKLRAPARFSDRNREVTLEGEAYFDVRHLEGRPFLVHTGNLTTRVLGTAFDIKAYPGDDHIAITVTRGRVQVFSDKGTLGQVGANQQISFSRRTSTYTESTVDVGPVVSWKPEEIVLDNMTLGEAALRLENRFGVAFQFTDSAARQNRVTATFSPDDSLGIILTVLCTVTKTSYTIDGRTVTINGSGTP